jgi:hypothetical protein
MRQCYIQYMIYAKMNIIKWEEFFTNNFPSAKCFDVEKFVIVREVIFLRKAYSFFVIFQF